MAVAAVLDLADDPREHVRVARALERLSRTVAPFARGRLSYSKVRAIVHLDDVQHEEALLAIAVDASMRPPRSSSEPSAITAPSPA